MGALDRLNPSTNHTTVRITINLKVTRHPIMTQARQETVLVGFWRRETGKTSSPSLLLLLQTVCLSSVASVAKQSILAFSEHTSDLSLSTLATEDFFQE